MIRVAHIWNTAGIGGLLARYMDRIYNFESICLMRENHDPYHLANEKVHLFKMSSKLFITKCLFEVKDSDIVHIHGGFAWLRFFKSRYPNKKYIIHLHGSEIRDKWDEVDLSGFDKVIVSTPDLLEDSVPGTVYLPNLVDWELVSRVKWVGPKKNKAYHWDLGALVEASNYALMNGLELVVQSALIDHPSFLHIIGGYEFYVDVKRSGFPYILEAMSQTGLEALALGCKVINWQGNIIREFPDDHLPLNVAEKLKKIYRDVLDDR